MFSESLGKTDANPWLLCGVQHHQSSGGGWGALCGDWWGTGPRLLAGIPDMNDMTHIYTQTRPNYYCSWANDLRVALKIWKLHKELFFLIAIRGSGKVRRRENGLLSPIILGKLVVIKESGNPTLYQKVCVFGPAPVSFWCSSLNRF